MNSFKFVVRPEFLTVNLTKHASCYLQIDITTMMQYLCIRNLLSNSKYRRVFDFHKLPNSSDRYISEEGGINDNFISLCTQVFDLQYKYYSSYGSSRAYKYLCKDNEYIRKDNIYKLFTFDHGSFDKYLDLLNTDSINKNIYYLNDNKIIKKISDDYLKQLIITRKRIHNTMSDLVVYTDDSEIIKQVIRNNQEIINELKNSDKCDNYIEKNRIDLCNKLCKKQKTTVRKRKLVSIE